MEKKVIFSWVFDVEGDWACHDGYRVLSVHAVLFSGQCMGFGQTVMGVEADDGIRCHEV